MPKVSIIIPAYNQATFLAQAVESCLDQTHPSVEIIVVDDGSTDATPTVVRAFGDRIRYVRQDNTGLPGARNRGLHESTGDYLCFLDSDDFYHPAKLEKQIHALDTNPGLGLVYCDITTVNESGVPLREAPSIASLERQLSGDIFPSLMMGGYFPPHTVMIRRSVLDQVGGFDPELGGYADYDLWLRVSAAGHRALFQAEPLAFYRTHTGSMSKDGEHMAKTQIASLTKAARTHPEGVARGVHDLQKATEELFHANRWLKSRWEPALASSHTAAGLPGQAENQFQFLPNLNRGTLVKGEPDQHGIWDVKFNHVTSQALLLQPPAELAFHLPTPHQGQLRTAVAIHPDAWTKPGAGGCEFHVRADGRVAHVVALDPVRLPGDRGWHELNMTIPANPRGMHRISFETKTIGTTSEFRWAVWRAPLFVWENQRAHKPAPETNPIVRSLNAA